MLQKINDTTYRTGDGEMEIGDSQQSLFFTQIKLLRFGNVANFSARLILPDYAGVLSEETDEVVFRRLGIECRFRETQNPTRELADYHSFVIVLSARPASNALQFSVRTKWCSLHPQGIQTGQAPDFINSIAVIADGHLPGEFGGRRKITSLRRPRISDSLGANTWCDWAMLSPELIELRMPAAFLDAAVYPVRIV